MKKRKVIVGSRDSKLAIVQTRLVMDEIAKNHPELDLELITMKTTGDKILDKTLDKIGGKGLFVKELDDALLDGKVDITIHSLKDMPMDPNPELPLVAFPKRGNPYDALVLPKNCDKLDLDKAIGSSSARRNIQLGDIYGDFKSKSVRGNVITRLKKLDDGEYGSLVLAYAGLERLGLDHRISKVFDHTEMIPSAGQGILVVQGRKNVDYSFLDCVNDKKSEEEAKAERQFVRFLDGGCSSPIGAFSIVNGDEIEIFGMYVNEKTGEYIKGAKKGKVKNAKEMAIELAVELKGAI